MAKTVFTDQQIITQISSGYKQSGQALTYGFPTTASWFPYAEKNGFSAMSPTQQAMATLAIQLWDDLIAPDFSLNATDPTKASVKYMNTTTNVGYAHAYYPTGTQAGGSVWFNSTYGTNSGTNNLQNPVIGAWGFQTYIHETGHALGLDHPGAYNGGSPTYANNAEYAQDSLQYTIMSYFTANNTGADWVASDGNTYYAQTPMIDDIMVIQAIYGAETTTRTGDTVYGFNSNADRSVFDFSVNKHPVLSIWDSGGIDTLDLSGFSTASVISLVPGTFSNADAMTSNISIARNTWIENAIGGSGNDTITGNDLANKLIGNAGNDTINGGLGNDILIGGAGADKLQGGDGDDIIYYDAADGMANVNGGTGFDSLLFQGAWQAINLVLYGFEQSLLMLTDTASQSWTTKTDVYDLSGNIIRSETQNDNGTASIVEYDVYNQYSWSTRTRSYDASGTMTNEVLAPDGGGGPSPGTNLAPTDLALSASSVIEGAAVGTVVGTLSATDPTAGETFTYALLNNAGGRFSLNGAQLVVANAALLDFETATSHAVTVQVTDSVGNTYQEVFTIGVTNNTSDDVAPSEWTTVTRTGTNSNNSISGTTGKDWIQGLGGNDTISGNNGNDKIEGGTGNDILNGNAGNDYLLGDDNNDTLNGGAGGDNLDGGAGTDTLSYAGSAAVNVNLGTGTVSGGDALGDLIFNFENILGSSNADILTGSSGANTIDGGAGNDSIFGAEGNDRLIGNAGTDTLDGGLGQDTFVLSRTASSRDTIQNFVSADDILEISRSDFGSSVSLGALSASAFVTNATGAAGDSNDRFIFNTANNTLYFDSDGTGRTSSVAIAVFTGTAPGLTASDFLIV